MTYVHKMGIQFNRSFDFELRQGKTDFTLIFKVILVIQFEILKIILDLCQSVNLLRNNYYHHQIFVLK